MTGIFKKKKVENIYLVERVENEDYKGDFAQVVGFRGLVTYASGTSGPLPLPPNFKSIPAWESVHNIVYASQTVAGGGEENSTVVDFSTIKSFSCSTTISTTPATLIVNK